MSPAGDRIGMIGVTLPAVTRLQQRHDFAERPCPIGWCYMLPHGADPAQVAASSRWSSGRLLIAQRWS
jgi:hypothetical protein